MHLQRLRLTQFRNYHEEEVSFTSGLNCIEGVNGSGKSNLLEGVYLLSTGKSFRTSRLHDLIQHTKESFALEAVFSKEGISQHLKISLGPEGRRVLHNHTPYTSFLPLLGLLPTVFLSPEDSSILAGSPADRRRFLDLHLSQIDPLYIYHLGRYQKAMKQRNTLLKQKQSRGIHPWEHIMAVSAYYITAKRAEALQYLQPPAEASMKEFSDYKESFSLTYISSLVLQKSYEEQWEKTRRKEMEVGASLLGPHRDDILFSINGKEAKTFASEGQKRCCVAALRLAEWKKLKEITGFSPLFGIDDFGAHLDKERLFFLQEPLKHMGQVFLSAPSFEGLPSAHRVRTDRKLKDWEKTSEQSKLVLGGIP